MSADENKALVRRFMEGGLNLDAVDQFAAPDMIDHSRGGAGREGLRQALGLFAAAFPDWQTTIEDLIAEGDKVVLRGVGRGTHRGAFMGIAPTGKQVTLPGIHIMRIADGKIVEHWAQLDDLGLMQQLGMAPAPGQGGV
ncbi:MAG: ester cyclase [Thermomicrobia bacterium]|nr:ester cyclase [Thermomicrobia bacterium]